MAVRWLYGNQVTAEAVMLSVGGQQHIHDSMDRHSTGNAYDTVRVNLELCLKEMHSTGRVQGGDIRIMHSYLTSHSLSEHALRS